MTIKNQCLMLILLIDKIYTIKKLLNNSFNLSILTNFSEFDLLMKQYEEIFKKGIQKYL